MERFTRALGRLLVFPRFGPVTRLPAHTAIPPVRVFARIPPATYFAALVTGYTSSKCFPLISSALHWSHVFTSSSDWLFKFFSFLVIGSFLFPYTTVRKIRRILILRCTLFLLGGNWWVSELWQSSRCAHGSVQMYGKSQDEKPDRPRREGCLPETENRFPEEICSGEKVRENYQIYLTILYTS